MVKTKVKRKDKAAAAATSSNGLNRSERRRRSSLPEDHKLRISEEDPMYLPIVRNRMKRYGELLPRFYRYFNTGTREWVEWDKNLHGKKNKIEESALHRWARLNQNTRDIVVEENYDIGASSAISLNLSLNQPNSTGSSGASNNHEWTKKLHIQ